MLSKVGLKNNGGNRETLDKYIEEFGIDLTLFNENHDKFIDNSLKKRQLRQFLTLEDIISKPGVPYHLQKLKAKLIKAGLKEDRCEKCGLTDWMGQKITLQLHHKDGDRNNNTLENLEILCPNCHSQTDNYAGKSTKQPKI